MSLTIILPIVGTIIFIILVSIVYIIYKRNVMNKWLNEPIQDRKSNVLQIDMNSILQTIQSRYEQNVTYPINEGVVKSDSNHKCDEHTKCDIQDYFQSISYSITSIEENGQGSSSIENGPSSGSIESSSIENGPSSGSIESSSIENGPSSGSIESSSIENGPSSGSIESSSIENGQGSSSQNEKLATFQITIQTGYSMIKFSIILTSISSNSTQYAVSDVSVGSSSSSMSSLLNYKNASYNKCISQCIIPLVQQRLDHYSTMSRDALLLLLNPDLYQKIHPNTDILKWFKHINHTKTKAWISYYGSFYKIILTNIDQIIVIETIPKTGIVILDMPHHQIAFSEINIPLFTDHVKTFLLEFPQTKINTWSIPKPNADPDKLYASIRSDIQQLRKETYREVRFPNVNLEQINEYVAFLRGISVYRHPNALIMCVRPTPPVIYYVMVGKYYLSDTFDIFRVNDTIYIHARHYNISIVFNFTQVKNDIMVSFNCNASFVSYGTIMYGLTKVLEYVVSTIVQGQNKQK